MNKQVISEIIQRIRETYSVLSLDNVIRDIEQSVEQFGVSVKYSDMSLLKEGNNVAGFVSSQNSQPVIVVNAKDVEVRRRFTIAHELGHVFLHWQWLPGDRLEENIAEVSYRNKSDYSPEESLRETEANYFAAEFLAPLEEVQRLVDNRGDSMSDADTIALIASHFKLSNASAAIRFAEVQR